MQKLNRFFYKVYTAGSGRLRRHRLTGAGRLAVGAMIASATFGVDTAQCAVYQLFALLTSVMLIARISTRSFQPRVSVTRTLPPFATAGEKLTYRVTLRNRSPKKLSGLHIQEKSSDGCPTFGEFMRARAPVEAGLTRWDRMVKYHRFEWLTEQRRKAKLAEHPLPEIGAGSYLNVYLDLEPRHRGYLELTGLSIRRTGPFGLYQAVRHLPLPDHLLILPRRLPLPPVRLPGTRKHNAGGVALASSVGNADEFRSLREYRPGDPMRRLHWKSVAKTGKLIIRENEDEYFVRHALILDTFTDPPGGRKFETAVSVAASFACTIRTQESMLDLLFVEEKAHCISAGRGVDHTGKLLETLACVDPCSDQPLSSLFPLIREQAALLSGCICILLAWDEARRELVRILAEHGIPVKILVITDEEPPENAGPVHFIHTGNPQEGLACL